MKNVWKRAVSLLLLICMIATMLPIRQPVRAEDSTTYGATEYEYVLDTDGIDAGAQYLIVSGSAGTVRALKLDTATLWTTADVGVTVSGDTIAAFDGEDSCLWTFSNARLGTVSNGSHYLVIDQYCHFETNAATLQFTSLGGGAYGIYIGGGANNNLQHLAYGLTDNGTTYKFYNRYVYGASGTDASVYDDEIYLFKRVEVDTGCSVTYDGNGHTAGTLPENSEDLPRGETYTVRAPESLRKEEGQETYLFQCWNTAADGSGEEYRSGDEITLEADLTLYAQWYQQTKFTLSMITYLDGEETDVEEMGGAPVSFYALLEGGDGTYIPLTRTAQGVYSARVADNGTYEIYAGTEDGYEAVHGHKVVIFNQDGSTECLHYTVSYDTAGGAWGENEDPGVRVYHATQTVSAVTQVPTREGYQFLGWKDQKGNEYAPGAQITASIAETVTLTAQWKSLITVTVNIRIDHNEAGGGNDQNTDTMRQVAFSLLREENGVNLPVEDRVLSEGYTYDEEANVTTYTVVFGGMPQGIYNASCSKTSYEATITRQGEADQNQTIDIRLDYAPQNGDLYFDVVVNWDDDTEKALKPQAVNVKVTYWGYNEANELGWHIITQQAGTNAPVTVTLDENGRGTGFYPVWREWSGVDQAYEYRIAVTSFVLPDGTIVAASGDNVTYTTDGTGLYTAQISFTGQTRVPEYPEGSESLTDLSGVWFKGDTQTGRPVATVQIHPYTVTFQAGEGTLNGETVLTLAGQYRYPDLTGYVPVSNTDAQFIGWYINGQPAENMAGRLLSSDVTYEAMYSANFQISGEITVEGSYLQDGQVAQIPATDRVDQLLVVLQKQVGDIYNDADSRIVTVTYTEDAAGNLTGKASYTFDALPDDGVRYRIQMKSLNFATLYDNNGDDAFTEAEAAVVVDPDTATATVDGHLSFSPDSYQQAVLVDASQIQENMRPTGALAQILYRDLGDVHNYELISQHTVDPYGEFVDTDRDEATGIGFVDVWNWHTNGTLYEYQLQLRALYGSVEGAYTPEGTLYTADSPFTVKYGSSNNYLQQVTQSGVMLQATLIPKEYPVILDLGEAAGAEVFGLDQYIMDDGSGNEIYAYMHTWSFADEFTAYPYREGYVFTGWESDDTDSVVVNDGTVRVGATLAKSVTLTAQWEPLTGTDYTIRYLELNTDQVLHGAQAVSGAELGHRVVAADEALQIQGYEYAGALVGGAYLDKTQDPAMVITDAPLENLMVIYYLPDGSDGYTEQVESNLEINKTAVLEDNGTYTITMDMYTKDNPITTLIEQDTPLDIVLVLDQSGSLQSNGTLDDLQTAVGGFLESVADHGRHNEVDHRIAIVGFAGNETDTASDTGYPYTGQGVLTSGQPTQWINTGVFDSNGQFHRYNVKGFNYTLLADTASMEESGIYYAKVKTAQGEKYLLLTYHQQYRHLITEEQARVALLRGETVYGYVYNDQGAGSFTELTRNSSGLWLYGDRQLYSADEFFTYHTGVWTYRDGIAPREIFAYGIGAAYTQLDPALAVYTRQETTDTDNAHSIYKDALVPVSVGANGSGGNNPGLARAISLLGANSATRSGYGMEMANKVLAENPLQAGEERVRLVVMFTDGEPGHSGFSSSGTYYEQAVTEANNAIAQAYIAKNTHNAYVYTIGLYQSSGVEEDSDVAYYMNAMSSNYPNAQSMDDIKSQAQYTVVQESVRLEDNGKYYVLYNGSYYVVEYGYVFDYSSWRYRNCWHYERSNGRKYSITTTTYPTISGGKVNGWTIYEKGSSYQDTPYSGYYSTTESAEHLQEYFEQVLRDITTKITTEIILHNDTILRDIMNQGLMLTDATVITAYLQEGNYNTQTGEIDWVVDPNGQPVLEKRLSMQAGELTKTDAQTGLSIIVKNLDAENPTDPTAANYLPHTVDVTGFDYSKWYISDTNTEGYKLVVTIDRVEATEDVQWGRSTNTNQEDSGLWLPEDNGKRELLLPFDQPTTIFVERAYVLDYGKEFTLSGWYFDPETDDQGNVTQPAAPVHIDCDIENGMNWFDSTANAGEGAYGNTTYGKVSLEKGKLTYTPTTMNWGGYDQFYVFGDTWRKTVKAQDANENGNLWNKVTVIPANNIYYEDSFITTEGDTQNGITGFQFTGEWSVKGSQSGNTELPEHLESAPYGGVHGWTDALNDDQKYTDGSAHFTDQMGASVQFTFTGTGVEVYTVTNSRSGMVVAVLEGHSLTDSGEAGEKIVRSLAMDNLAVSGEYYHIPTVTFKDLPYGTYTLELYATVAEAAVEGKRYEYYIDGVRIHNPLGKTTNYQSDIVKDAYGLETNAVFTEIRDILLSYWDFNPMLHDSTDDKMGAVFIDWIREGQESGNDTAGTGQATYEPGTYADYGPKNEVYLKPGQAVVLSVDPANTYYVGMKSLTGAALTVNISGIDRAEPTAISLSHTTDLYYQVTPVDGYLVIQNSSEGEQILSLTNLRTTNLEKPVTGGGVLPITSQAAVAAMEKLDAYLLAKPEPPEETTPEADTPNREQPTAADRAEAYLQLANALFRAVRHWLQTK